MSKHYNREYRAALQRQRGSVLRHDPNWIPPAHRPFFRQRESEWMELLLDILALAWFCCSILLVPLLFIVAAAALMVPFGWILSFFAAVWAIERVLWLIAIFK